jgi:hypothetical protein
MQTAPERRACKLTPLMNKPSLLSVRGRRRPKRLRTADDCLAISTAEWRPGSRDRIKNLKKPRLAA